MAGEWLLTTQFLAAGAMIVLALWLLWLDFNSRVVRAFAVFLVVRGAHIAVNQVFALNGGALWYALSGYLALAILPALLSFIVAYSWPLTSLRTSLVRGGLLGGAVVVEAVFAFDHCSSRCARPDGLVELGPLAVLQYGIPLALGVTAVLFAMEARRLPEGPRRSGAVLVAAAFILESFFEAGLVTVALIGYGIGPITESFAPSGWVVLAFSAWGSGMLASGLAFAVLAVPTRGRRAMAGAPRRIGAGLALAVLTLTFIQWGEGLTGITEQVGLLVIGAWRLVLPVLVAFAIVRYKLFGLDVKLNGTFGHGTVAATFLSVFFITSEMAQQFFSGKVGPFLGIVAAGFLVFAIAPLEHFGRNLAHRIMGAPQPGAQLSTDERLSLFREQASIAWQDGALTRRERLLLEQLRERLGISPEEATRIEGEAVRMEAPHIDVGTGGMAQTKGLS